MRKNQIAQQAIEILNNLGIEIGNQPEILDLEPPIIGAIGQNEELVGVTDEGVTRELPRLNDDFEDLDSLPVEFPTAVEFPTGLEEMLDEAERIRESSNNQETNRQPSQIVGPVRGRPKQIWEVCAWYAPIHYSGIRWGIYIREECLKRMMYDVLHYVNWREVGHISLKDVVLQVRNACFYYVYFHEQFHHKVESLGFRALIATQSDTYRRYKSHVYGPTYLTSDCLEESLANADAYIRFGEKRYRDRLDREVILAIRAYARDEMAMSPPGYQEGLRYITKRHFKMGLQELHCQLVEATPKPMSLKPYMWDIAPKMITGLMNIETEIYTVVKSGTSSIFSSSFDPKYTTSSRNLEKALTKHWGYSKTPKQGKGSHVKYQRQSAHGTSTIVLSGNRRDLPMKDIKDAIEAVSGRRDLSLLPQLLAGSMSN